MRKYASSQLRRDYRGLSDTCLRQYSNSCVSQRDIQRVFTFYNFFNNIYNITRKEDRKADIHQRALYMALGIVYYMRLNAKFRTEYQNELDEHFHASSDLKFSTVYKEELNYFIDLINPPSGIARTIALKENILATVVCTSTKTPLIIVGAPGSSKTLSFNITTSCLKGQESKIEMFQNADIFKSLDPHIYQCSRCTTSNEIENVFSRAVRRQISHDQYNLPINCVVFMDEVGLPEESHESLKVLHYHLDQQKVSFVAITNHVLDAAKTNRAISLFRPEPLREDLEELAKGCLNINPNTSLQTTIVNFCSSYSQCLKKVKIAKLYGLRDFIHFMNYLRRNKPSNIQVLSPELVMHALERNFNGSADFHFIATTFLEAFNTDYDHISRREVLEVFKESMEDQPQPQQDLIEYEVRYKLIIDPSDDDSVLRSLFFMGFLDRTNTRMFICSNFPNDGQLQQINTISGILHSAIEGHTVIMNQTDTIHDSFYDLFNQRFRQINNPGQQPRYYANVAIGAYLKPSRVDPKFQCIVVVKSSEINDVPPPFLNRFEKYYISHNSILQIAKKTLPPCVAAIVSSAREQVYYSF